MPKENQPEKVPDDLYDREATPREIEEVGEAMRSAEQDGRESTPEEIIAAWKEGDKWLAIIGSPEYRQFIADGVIQEDVIRDQEGGFKRISIRDSKGNIVFYSTEKEFEDAVRREWGIQESRPN